MKKDFYCQEILSGKTQIKKEYESENVLAYHHTKPSYPVHIVIVPKKHIGSLQEIRDEDNEIILEIIQVARDLSKKLDLEQGIRLITNLGKFQDTPHLHFHLVSGDK